MTVCYLLTPFSAKSANESPEDYEAVQTAIRQGATAAGVELQRADDVFAAGILIDQVLGDLSKADLVLAVCTGKNANVFYELGFAESLGHRPILVARSEADLPFDKAHWRCQMYADGVQTIDDLAERVTRSLKETRAEQTRVGREPHRAVKTMLEHDPEYLIADGKSGLFLRNAKQAVAQADSRLNEAIQPWVPVDDPAAGWLQDALRETEYVAAAQLLAALAPATEYDVDLLSKIATPVARDYLKPILGTPFGQRWRYLVFQVLVAICVETERWAAIGALLRLPAPRDARVEAPLLINPVFSYPQAFGGQANRAAADLVRFVRSPLTELARVWKADPDERVADLAAANLALGLSRIVWLKRTSGVIPTAIGFPATFPDWDPRAYRKFAQLVDRVSEIAQAVGASNADELGAVVAEGWRSLVFSSEKKDYFGQLRSWADLVGS